MESEFLNEIELFVNKWTKSSKKSFLLYEKTRFFSGDKRGSFLKHVCNMELTNLKKKNSDF